jgi:DNA-binding NarL/FixJ family response regulator
MTWVASERGQAMPITVFVVDDHILVREAVAQVINLEEDLEVVGDGAGSADALEELARIRPDVLVVDLEMPDIRGAEFIARAKERLPDLRILVCSMHASLGYVEDALRRGADGYVLKSSPSALLMEGIRMVAADKGYIDPGLQSDVLRVLKNPSERLTSKELTARELDVLRLMAEGLSNDEIARQTQQSLETVKLRIRRLFQKLGATDRTHAITMAFRQNLIR